MSTHICSIKKNGNGIISSISFFTKLVSLQIKKSVYKEQF